MKILLYLLLFSSVGCTNTIQKRVKQKFPNSEVEFWIRDSHGKQSNEEWITIWRFTNNGDFHVFYLGRTTKSVVLSDQGDNVVTNSFYFKSIDTIVLNESPFPILNQSQDSIVLKNIYGVNYHPTKEIILSRWKLKDKSSERLLFNQKVDSILNTTR